MKISACELEGERIPSVEVKLKRFLQSTFSYNYKCTKAELLGDHCVAFFVQDSSFLFNFFSIFNEMATRLLKINLVGNSKKNLSRNLYFSLIKILASLKSKFYMKNDFVENLSKWSSFEISQIVNLNAKICTLKISPSLPNCDYTLLECDSNKKRTF